MGDDKKAVYNFNISDSVIGGDLNITTESSKKELSNSESSKMENAVRARIKKLSETEDNGETIDLINQLKHVDFDMFEKEDALRYVITIRDACEMLAQYFKDEEEYDTHLNMNLLSIKYNKKAANYGFEKEGAEFWEFQCYLYMSKVFRKAGLIYKEYQCYSRMEFDFKNKHIKAWAEFRERVFKRDKDKVKT
jgi:hypothetical protein